MDKIKLFDRLKIHGFVMLQKLNDGDIWRVVGLHPCSIHYVILQKEIKYGKLGKKRIGHRIDDLECMISCFEKGFNNGIEILQEKTNGY